MVLTYLRPNIFSIGSKEGVSLASLARQLYIVRAIRANFVLITRKEGGA